MVFSLAAQQEIIVAGVQQLLKTLSQLEDIQQKRVPQINQLLKNILQQNTQYGNILLAEPDGTVIASARPFTPPLSIADRKFYRDVIKTKQFSPGEYVIGKTAHKPLYNFGFPVFAPDGSIRGIIAVGIDLSYLDKTFKHFVLPEGSNFTIIDHKGIIIHRAIEAEKYVGKPILSENMKTITEGLDEDDYSNIGIDGLVRHYFYKKLYMEGNKEPYLFITASVPDEYIQKTSQKHMLTHMIIFGWIFIASLTGAILIAKYKITSKVVTLIDFINALAAGQSDRKVGDQVVGGEFGLLAQAFDQMNANLQQREKDNLQAKAELQDALLFNQHIIQGVKEGIIVYDHELRYQIWNPFMEELTGIKSADVLGKLPHEVFPNFNEVGILGRIEKVLRGETVEPCEIEYHIPQTGKSGWTSDCCYAMRNALGEIIGVIGTVRDITESKNIEEQLRQSQKMEAVGQLAGGIAHDFNNILQVIIGYGSLLTMTNNLSNQQKEGVEQILAASEKATRLTNGLLAFSRKQVMNIKTMDLNDIVSNLNKFLVRIIGEDIELRTNLCEKNLLVNVDSGQIEQVLLNLATNARDSMARGGILTIGTGLQNISEQWVQKNGFGSPGSYAVLSVSDTGKGMDEKTRLRIFEPFFTTKEIGKGTGLGMAIVFGIIQQHNGFMEVFSELDKGTVFRIYLPFEEKLQDALTEVTEPTQLTGGPETILLAEDDESIRKLMANILKNYGYSIILADDGQEAISQFTKNRDQISLIIMDVLMPKKSGKEAYDEICKLQSGVKILYISGYTSDYIENRGISIGEINIILKPVKPHDLIAKVREMLTG